MELIVGSLISQLIFLDQDLKQAYRYFYKAANQGDRKAGKNLDSITRQLTEEDLEALRAEMGEAN